MARVWSARSKANLVGVHPDLVRVLVRARDEGRYDLVITSGGRTDDQQMRIYGQGRTPAQCVAKGVPASYSLMRDAKGKKLPIVTWTLDSNHKKKRSGFFEAVDAYVIKDGVIRYDLAPELATDVLKAARAEAVAVRWGGNWDGDNTPGEKGETDLGHFELKQ